MSHEESKFITIAVPQAEVYTFIYANRKYATWYHNKNVHVGTFHKKRNTQRHVCFKTYSTWDIMSGAKRVFGFFPGADKRICGMFVGFDRVTAFLTLNVCWVALKLMLCDVLKYLPFALHLNLPNSMNKSECDIANKSF